MRDFRSLQVWQKSHDLALRVYRNTAGFPREEQFGLTSQLRRSAVSIPSNIAEGCGRTGEAELARFCEISAGSASELEYQLLLSHELGFLDDEIWRQIDAHTTEVKRMLSSFIARLRTS